MKKIMFNDKFLLTKAVLGGTKTMTRRIVDVPTESVFKTLTDCHGNKTHAVGFDEKTLFKCETRYQIGEALAIAQRYLDIQKPQFDKLGHDVAGNTNKMFVKADLMPHHIRITDVMVERLQDITDEDCWKEGILHFIPSDDEECTEDGYGYGYITSDGEWFMFDTPREAFAELINEICGEGTWQRNPWMEVYTFERVD